MFCEMIKNQNMYWSYFVNILKAFLGDSPRESALLAISSLVRTFCESQTDCQQHPEVQVTIYHPMISKLLVEVA